MYVAIQIQCLYIVVSDVTFIFRSFAGLYISGICELTVQSGLLPFESERLPLDTIVECGNFLNSGGYTYHYHWNSFLHRFRCNCLCVNSFSAKYYVHYVHTHFGNIHDVGFTIWQLRQQLSFTL